MYRSMCLGCILEQYERVPPGNIRERSHVRWLAKQVYRHNSASLAGNDRFLNAFRVEQVSLGIDVDQCHAKSPVKNRGGARNKRQIRNNDLATVFHRIVIGCGCDGDAKCVSAMRHEQPVPCAAVTSPFRTKSSRKWLRQSFNAGQKDLQKPRPQLSGPFNNRRGWITWPRTIPGISYRQTALSGQLASEPARAARQWRQRFDRAFDCKLRRLPRYLFYAWHT